MERLSRFVVRLRYELAALALAGVVALVHVWSDGAPVPAAGTGPLRAREVLLRGLASAEGKAGDLQFLMRGSVPPLPELRVVAIDERSVQRHGRWPWPRDLQARALDRLVRQRPAAVGLDITFTDQAEAGPWASLLAALDRASAGLGGEPRATLAEVR
ncbi:MAG TPA: CHASE2 domain-containing protein, partial [Myxococcaceae bacterium]|nr:CHASE2 domain-containing protein [Myxococcaceae bacterium]